MDDAVDERGGTRCVREDRRPSRQVIRPDPRSMGFILSGSGWGATSGALLGVAVSGKD